MSALGQKRTLRKARLTSALPPKADIASASPSRTIQYAPITRLQQPRHFTQKAFRLRHWREARSHDASLINQELREVPFYAVAQQPALLLPKPNVEGVGVLAVDVDLGEQWESYAIGSVAEGSNLRVRPRFQMAELVAWEGQAKPRGWKLFVEVLQAIV